MKVRELQEKQGQPSAAPTHIYDPATKRVWTAEMHGHLRAVRKDIIAGRPIWIPKEKNGRPVWAPKEKKNL